MDIPDSDNTEERGKRRFDQGQYDFLRQCSKKRAEGIKAWNHWRRSRPGTQILLQDADLHELYLCGADVRDACLDGANLVGADLRSARVYRASFGGTVLDGANLRAAVLSEAQFHDPSLAAVCTGARTQRFSQPQCNTLIRCSEQRDPSEWNKWRESNPDADILLEGAPLSGLCLAKIRFDTRDPGEPGHLTGEVCLQDADFRDSDLENVRFHNAHLEGASLWGAHLRHADMYCTHLEHACLEDSYWEGAYFEHTYLQGARCRAAVVDGFTLIWRCRINCNTDFSEVALNNARIDAATKQLLEYNIRRMNWERWYKAHPRLKGAVKLFWWLSDYGLSTGRIVAAFFALAILFAVAYYLLAVVNPPGAVNSLVEGKEGFVQPWLVPVRAVYFSIVTMTTLGFGDMHTNCQSLLGHLLLTLQVILGYVMLGALVTRFAVLFVGGGPAGRFSESKEEQNADAEEI